MKDTYIRYFDIVDGSEPCTEVECEKCPFDSQVGCKWIRYIDSLPKYKPQMAEVRSERNE